MDQAIRQPLTRRRWPLASGAASLPVLLIMLPLVPGLWWALSPALSADVWIALWLDPQWPQAMRTTLVSAGVGSLVACALTAALVIGFYPGAHWTRLQRRLPLLLALPHAAFAVGLLFLLAPSGWLARLVAGFLGWTEPPGWVSVQDPWGLSLALALALKESWFLLWVLAAVLGEQSTQRQLSAARSLGYTRAQAWRHVIGPAVLPRLGWPLAAVLAYSLSVVDMAVVLGPSTPPTLAVLGWQWLTDPDPQVQARGAAVSLVLLGLLILLAGMVRAGWMWLIRCAPYPDGRRSGLRDRRLPTWAGRWTGGVWATCVHLPLTGIGLLVVGLLVVWSLADGWFFPALWPESLSVQTWLSMDWQPMWTTLWLATASSLSCLIAAVVWLEWGPRSGLVFMYLPLIIPALPLAAGQYATLLHTGWNGSAPGVVWSHLLWVLPYTLLVLAGPYRAFDARLITTARALGLNHWQTCWRVKWPLLLRPLLAAVAVGFAVSVAQYLPTLFAGGGRFSTVTTEAVALSAGGNRRTLAAQALLQVVLPLAAFAVAAGLPAWLARHRKGWR